MMINVLNIQIWILNFFSLFNIAYSTVALILPISTVVSGVVYSL